MARPISTPAPYAPAYAIGYAGDDGDLAIVKASQPLPVATVEPVLPAPLEGTTAASTVAGPFAPLPGRSVIVALSGTWTGTVSVQRSTDGGASRQRLTAAGAQWAQFSGNACEAVWEEAGSGAELYLDVSLSSGALTYRLGH